MSTSVPENLKYTQEHEWVSIDGDTATIGITDFAQSSLGDIVFVELPEKESELKQDATFGVVESIKSVSDLYAPLSGQVIEKNSALEDTPEAINEDCYAAWLIKVKISNQDELNKLLNASTYEDFCNKAN